MLEVLSRLRRFLGHKALSQIHFPARRRPDLAVELLESRDLLSLPAPSGEMLQHPVDNPALPASFQPFMPPVDVVTIDPAAPQLGTLTDQGGPDDTLAVTGFQFSTLTGANAGQDTVFQVFGQTTATNGTLRNATIQQLDGDRSAVTLDASLPKNSMYLVWAENAAGASMPFAVNRTEAWWVGPNAANPGNVVSVYGRNLSNGAATPMSWIYLQPDGAPGRWIKPTAVNPYKVDFVVPKDLAPGSYQIWVHNGHGGQYGWSSPVTLTVQPSYPYGNVVVRLSDFVGGRANTGVDATPAFQAAMQRIGNNSGTIILDTGNYYLSGAPLYITGGMGLGVHLQGAGKNSTFLRSLPSASFAYFITTSPDSSISDLTINALGATIGYSDVVHCTKMTNVRIVTIDHNDVGGGGPYDFAFKNCDFIGRGVIITTPNEIIVSGCNFYATNQTDSLLYVWGGHDISVTKCTAQDYQLNSTNVDYHGKGRFYTGTAIWGSQSNIYIGDNRTIQFAPPKTYGDQNTGEQIMWEGSWGTQSNFAVSATPTTLTLPQLANDYVGREVVIVSGKGIGQHRTIAATDFASGGTTVTIDRPWDVLPDSTSQVNLITTIRQAVIYHNQLQGNSNFHSASTAFETFQGSFDFVLDRNTISNFRWGINDFSWNDPAVGPATQVCFSNLYQNNIIINCLDGIRSVDSGNPVSGETATHMGNIYRRNTLSGIQHANWYISGDTGNTMDFDVFEHNTASDAQFGVFVYKPVAAGTDHFILYKNVFNRGMAPLIGSQPIALQTGFLPILSGNTFLNFLQPQNPKGTINDRMPVFSWNTIPGTDHYGVLVQDVTTGIYVQKDMNAETNSWTNSTALTVGHNYRWWVRSYDAITPISNWSGAQAFYLAPLKQPILSNPSGSIPANTTPVLIPTFSWSAVTNADSYQLRLNDITTGHAGVIQQTVAQTSLVSPINLLPGDSYQWMVRALKNDGNASAWSQVKNFSLALMPPTTGGPTGSTIASRPTFVWDAVLGAHNYDVIVNDLTAGQSAFVRSPLSGAGIVTTTFWTMTSSLIPGHSYKWSVRAINVNGVIGPWSTGVVFVLAFLDAPVLTNPTGTAPWSGTTYYWNAVAGADYYDFNLIDVTAGNTIILRNTHVSWSSLASPNLVAGHTYRWSVRAFSDGGNYSAWSNIAQFTAI